MHQTLQSFIFLGSSAAVAVLTGYISERLQSRLRSKIDNEYKRKQSESDKSEQKALQQKETIEKFLAEQQLAPVYRVHIHTKDGTVHESKIFEASVFNGWLNTSKQMADMYADSHFYQPNQFIRLEGTDNIIPTGEIQLVAVVAEKNS
jgi:hypothetical protein